MSFDKARLDSDVVHRPAGSTSGCRPALRMTQGQGGFLLADGVRVAEWRLRRIVNSIERKKLGSLARKILALIA